MRKCVLFFISILVLTFFTSIGCGGRGGDTYLLQVSSFATLTGTIYQSNLAYPAIRAQSYLGQPVNNAKVWLEERPDLYAFTDFVGAYSISNVPQGVYHVVAKANEGGKEYKMRSNPVSLQPSETKEEIDITLYEATAKVTGIIKKENGETLPQGTMLQLWGETFPIESDYTFTTPALPLLEANKAINDIVLFAGTQNEIKFPLSFASSENMPDVEIVVPLTKARESEIPKVSLMALDNYELSTTANAGEQLTLRATVFPSDVANENIVWRGSGTFDSTMNVNYNTREKLWTAPNTGGLATIEVALTHQNNTAVARLKIMVTTPNLFKVIYSGNENSSGTVPIDYNNYSPGHTVYIKQNTGALQRDGFVFMGWNTQPDGRGDSYAPGSTLTMPSKELVLYANWDVQQVRRVYYLRGAEVLGASPIDDNSYSPGDMAIVLDNTGNMTKEGYIFVGWQDNAKEGVIYSPGEQITIENSNINLVAYWARAYKITYHKNGASEGEAPIDENRYKSGATTTVLGNTGELAREAKTFAGWNTRSDGSGELYYPENEIRITERDIDLFAVWTDGRTYKVSYEGNGNSTGYPPEDSNNYQPGSEVTVKENTQQLFKTNYNFIGWNTQQDGKGIAYKPGVTFTIGTADVILYAQWSYLKEIVYFRFETLTPIVSGSINNDNNTVIVFVPFGTNLRSLTPSITHTGKNIEPSSNTPQDFSTPVIYTITANDNTTKDYIVTVTELPPSSAKSITRFSFENQGFSEAINGLIDEDNKQITIRVPYGTILKTLVATIEHTGISATGNGLIRDYSEPVRCTVTAQDGTSNDYLITVIVESPSQDTEITKFDIAHLSPTVEGNIQEDVITLIVPYGTDITRLTPTVLHNGKDLYPPSNKTEDFTQPRIYTVTAQGGNTRNYTVIVEVNDASSENKITSFIFPAVSAVGKINSADDTISVVVPPGTDPRFLTPVIAHTGDTIFPPSGEEKDFTSPVTYRVTAQNGRNRFYTVSVTVKIPSSEKTITEFRFNNPQVTGVINETNKTIVVTLPYGTPITALSPIITYTGVGIAPPPNQAQDFSIPVTYTITAEDNSTQDYIVTVVVLEPDSKSIIDFVFDEFDPPVKGLINEVTKRISLVVPYDASLTSIKPSITHTGKEIYPPSGIAQNFSDPSSPVTYKVTAADGSESTYQVQVTKEAAATTNSILEFEFRAFEPPIKAIITESEKTITAVVPFGTDLKRLVPTIIHNGDSVSPKSGVSNDFSEPQGYTVYAQSGAANHYTVTVSLEAGSSEKDILSFTFSSLNPIVEIDQANLIINVTVPAGTNLQALIPIIQHTGDSINPKSGAPNDFSTDTAYTVTAQNGTQKTYTVKVVHSASDQKQITEFLITNLAETVTGIINEDDSAPTIQLTVPFGTNLRALIPQITFLGKTVSPPSNQACNFTNPVPFTVYAADDSYKVYTVSVFTEQGKSDKSITSFAFASVPAAEITIDEENTKIHVKFPYGTNVTSLVPSITHNGVSINPSPRDPQDFTKNIKYYVTAEDGTYNEYEVIVEFESGTSDKDIIVFEFASLPSAIIVIDQQNTTITVTVPYGTNISNLEPTIQYTGETIEPLPSTPQDFSSGPVIYTVTAQDGSQKQYTVVFNLDSPPTNKSITSFEILGYSQANVYILESEKRINVTLPYGTNLTMLIPVISHTGTSINPGSGVTQDFSSSPVTYTVTAADGTTQDYEVYVTLDSPSSSNTITKFAFEDYYVTGMINEVTRIITVTLPAGTSLTALRPSITHTGTSIAPENMVAQDFTNDVTYTVTAQSGATRTYTVKATVEQGSSLKSIIKFNFTSPVAVGSINQQNKTIVLSLPQGTNVTNIIPEIEFVGASISPAKGQAQNFTNPVTYTVTADDGSTADYTVSVTFAAIINSFDFLGITPKVYGTVDNVAKRIDLTVPSSVDITALVPTIVHTGKTTAPASGEPRNFTFSQIYILINHDDTSTQYTVTVTKIGASDAFITRFAFEGLSPVVEGVIDEGSGNESYITLFVPKGTNITNLVPTIEFNGASILPASGVAQDFSLSIYYRVYSESGEQRGYVVTVNAVETSNKTIDNFDFDEFFPIIIGNINQTNLTITLEVPNTIDITALRPKIRYSGVSVSPGDRVEQDFTNPVIYTVTAMDGSTRKYTATVILVAPPGKEITYFAFENLTPKAEGVINQAFKQITVTVPKGTNKNALVPTIVHTGVAIYPQSGSAQNFNNIVSYYVTATDDTEEIYNVTVKDAN